MIAVTACYGEAHRPYLGALLESLLEQGVQTLVVSDAIPWLERYSNVQLIVPPDSWLTAGILMGRARRVASKVTMWRAAWQEIPDGEHVVFLDADTVVERDLELAFRYPFDIAATERTLVPWSLNTGVVFAKASQRASLFFHHWAELTAAVYDPALIAAAQSRWGALDQATFAMARTLMSGKESLTFLVLPMQEWNDVECYEHVRIHHFKGLLPYLLGSQTFGPTDMHYYHDHTQVFARWRGFYQRHQERVA